MKLRHFSLAVAGIAAAAISVSAMAQKKYDPGATDTEIHDTVLIAAAFCMFNRYVDGLGTWQPRDPAMYREMGQRMATQGYVRTGQ